MATASGIAAQVMYAKETTYGTFVAPTKAPDFLSEGVTRDYQRIESKGMRPGARTLRVKRRISNPKGAGGDIAHEVAVTGMGFLFEQMFNTVAITTPGGGTLSRLQSFTIGATDAGSITAQIGRPDVNGTVLPYTYVGGRITDWTFGLDVDGIALLTPTWDFQKEDRSQALATYTPPAAFPELLTFLGGSVKVGGTVVATVTKFSLKGSVGLKTDRYYIANSGLKAKPVPNDLYKITGEVDLDLNGTSLDDALDSGATTTIELILTGSLIETTIAYSLDIKLNAIQWDGDTPTVNGEDTIVRSAKFTALDDGTNPFIKWDYTTTDTTV